MKQLHYSLVDVFTNQPFGGNQLAVFPDARGLAPETMQALASEQGFELGRPSLVQVKIELDGQHITDVSIGGQCYFMGKGWITLAA